VALLLAVVLLLLAYEKWAAAGLVLGFGFALKITPAILLPLVFILAVRRRTMVQAFVYFVIAAVLPFIPYAIHGIKGIEYPFTYQLDRPLQVESVLAAPLLLGHVFGKVWLEIGTAYGSQFIAATGAGTLARLSGFLELIALVFTYWLIWRRRASLRATPRLVPLAALALILAFMTFGKVLSPQYFIWIIPAVALVIPERRLLAGLLIAALLLTQIEFPANYWSFIYLDRGAVLIVVERDAVLLVAFAVSLWNLWRLPDVAVERGGPPGRRA
jgi:4-amino-4-deoxy-L-arabinose transferase-like glycosyltransferase